MEHWKDVVAVINLVLTAVKSRTMLVVCASVLGVRSAILHRIYPIRLYYVYLFQICHK